MFFGKWKSQIKDILERLLSMLEGMSGQISQTNTAVLEQTEREKSEYEKIEAALKELSLKVSRQDMAVEDLLDIWTNLEEKNNQREEVQKALTEQKKTEKELLKLVMSYDSQMRMLIYTVCEQSPLLADQAVLMEKKMTQELTEAGITMIGTIGESVNYELHEVIQAEPTSEKERHGFVAQVVERGYMKNGTVLKKAKVCAYKYTEE